MKKKLCIVAPAEGAYSETFIQNHIRYLDFEKTVIYGTEIVEFKIDGTPIFPLTFYNRILKKIAFKFFMKEKDFFHKKRFKQLLKEKQIDIVLAEYGPLGSMITDLCSECQIPLVVHFHGYDASVHDIIEHYSDAYKNTFCKASAVVGVSTKMVNRLKSMSAEPSKVHYNPYGVNVDLDERKALPQKKIFLSVGRFVDKKAPHLTVLAFYKAFKNIESISLQMVGDGPLLNACKELVQALGLEQSVKFLGVKTNNEVKELMYASYAFLQHSVIAPDGNAEGTPLSILEACASGLPVISTKHGGIADVIDDGVNGILVDEFDIDEMAKAILRLVENETFAYELGKNARKNIISNFCLQEQIRKLGDIIHAAINHNEA